jgi:hypothetical protein
MENQPVNSSNKMYKIVVIVALVAALFSVGAAAFFYNDAQVLKEQTPEAVSEKNIQESDKVVGELSEILFVNSDQAPTVARVDNPEKLQESNPDFYKNIVIGDYLILYPQRAVIYRSSENKIINIAPIISTEQLTRTQEQQATQPAAEGSTGN